MKLKQSVNLVGVGAASGGLWGGVWGSLIGLLFLSPLAGFALGGSVAPVRESFPARWPITESMTISSVGDTLKPKTSALFLLVRKAQPEKVLSKLSRFRGRVLRTSLSPEQENRLQALSAQLSSQTNPTV